MKTVELVDLINHLTTDNDERQELWVRYLQDNDATVLSEHLADIRAKYSEDRLLQITLWRQIENPSDLNVQWLFDNFTDLEQTIMRLLILGSTLQQISGIKGIGEARLRHVISIICQNPCWKELDGTED